MFNPNNNSHEINAYFTYDPATMSEWIDIENDIITAQYYGNQRIAAKDGTKGWKQFDKSDFNLDCLTKPYEDWSRTDFKSHHIGILGELAFSKLTGEKTNLKLLSFGDGNEDFKNGVDIKTTILEGKQKDGALIENCYKKDLNQLSKRYVRIVIDFENKRACIVGWASTADIIIAPVHNLGKGNPKVNDNGDRFVLNYKDLQPFWTLPNVISAAIIIKRKADNILIKYATESVLDDNPDLRK